LLGTSKKFGIVLKKPDTTALFLGKALPIESYPDSAALCGCARTSGLQEDLADGLE
jgi:hypothetical protein